MRQVVPSIFKAKSQPILEICSALRMRLELKESIPSSPLPVRHGVINWNGASPALLLGARRAKSRSFL
jgi:hypothetical protein